MGVEGYKSFVNSLRDHIVQGNIIQAVPSQRLSRPLQHGVTAFDIYRSLRVVNPSPYMFYLDLGGFQICGASPEQLVKVERGGRVTTHPIAGTRRRGSTAEEDEALQQELLSSEKERAEHIMLVDLGRNDLGRVCTPGSVKVESLMHVEKYSHVQHIVSVVSGQLSKGRTVYDAFRAVFPAGTVSGAPKIRAHAAHRRAGAGTEGGVRRCRRLPLLHRHAGYRHRHPHADRQRRPRLPAGPGRASSTTANRRRRRRRR